MGNSIYGCLINIRQIVSQRVHGARRRSVIGLVPYLLAYSLKKSWHLVDCILRSGNFQRKQFSSTPQKSFQGRLVSLGIVYPHYCVSPYIPN